MQTTKNSGGFQAVRNSVGLQTTRNSEGFQTVANSRGLQTIKNSEGLQLPFQGILKTVCNLLAMLDLLRKIQIANNVLSGD